MGLTYLDNVIHYGAINEYTFEWKNYQIKQNNPKIMCGNISSIASGQQGRGALLRFVMVCNTRSACTELHARVCFGCLPYSPTRTSC